MEVRAGSSLKLLSSVRARAFDKHSSSLSSLDLYLYLDLDLDLDLYNIFDVILSVMYHFLPIGGGIESQIQGCDRCN